MRKYNPNVMKNFYTCVATICYLFSVATCLVYIQMTNVRTIRQSVALSNSFFVVIQDHAAWHAHKTFRLKCRVYRYAPHILYFDGFFHMVNTFTLHANHSVRKATCCTHHRIINIRRIDRLGFQSSLDVLK